MNQCEKIVKYINDFGSINQLEAIKDLGIMRLASRICDLRKQGYEVISKNTKGVNRYGETVYYSTYKLK